MGYGAAMSQQKGETPQQAGSLEQLTALLKEMKAKRENRQGLMEQKKEVLPRSWLSNG
jgi:hypothetical protein